MWIEVCQIHGQDSRSSHCSKKRKTSFRMHVVQGAPYEDPSNNQTGLLWPEIWSDMSKAAQKKEKQEWAMEKPKLDNARKN